MATAEEQSRDFTAATSSGRRLAFLDVLRGLAALAVLFQHMYQGLSPAFSTFTQQWFNFGAFGVALFFLVSGFIIPASLEKHRSLREFWKGRFFRLFPLYLFVLLVVIITDRLHLTPTMDPACHPQAWCIAANTTMMEEYLGVGPILAVAWTLGLEMVFYILCSLAFALGWLRHSRALVLWCSGALLVLTGLGLLVHRSYPAGRFGLLATCFLGTLLYRVYKGVARTRDLWVLLPLWLALLAGFWLRYAVYPSHAELPDFRFSMASVTFSWAGAYLLFLTLFALRSAATFPRPLEWLGKISYSFYLNSDYIPPVLMMGNPLGVHTQLLLVAIVVLVLLVVSAATYYGIERPAMRLGRTSAHRKTLMVA